MLNHAALTTHDPGEEVDAMAERLTTYVRSNRLEAGKGTPPGGGAAGRIALPPRLALLVRVMGSIEVDLDGHSSRSVKVDVERQVGPAARSALGA